ncbi:efflux RND transporter periplasmic adaptor subunit [Polyangium spumosum]|uniref:Efflux RND transporter periplasmic adaptor subunit n=1 Tax=Polyangium spumosum TaxID=889282 RepID=A0A6N7PGS1_9BACT|nr:efflux RND transporter periplasmic adaptor subunit [Polyangium spumosum]MRG91199.1 efflux RND transporter periplasmic adaptor subunit [Polyangium spumosum]
MSTVATTGTTRKFGAGKLITLVVVLGTAGLIGVRVKSKVAQKKALEAQTAVMAEQAAAPESPTAPPKVTARGGTLIAKPEPMRWQPRVAVTGTLEPIQQADVGFKAGGRLLTIKTKMGDVVKAGQVLGVVDASEASAQANVAQTGVRVAEISLEMAKDAQKRSDTLFQQSAVPEAEKTTATQRALLAAAQLEQARAQARAASVMVGNAMLTAPFGGLVTRAPNGIGKIVSPGEPLFHIEDTSVLKLSASVSENDADVFEVGAAVSIDGSPVAAGKVTAVLGSLDPQTRRVPVIAEIPNGAEVGLLSGSFVRAQIVATKSIEVLRLPASALRPGAQDEIVVVQDGKAHLARVSFTIAPDGSLYVRKGLDAGATVVANPSPEVKEGEAIDLGPVPAAPTK